MVRGWRSSVRWVSGIYCALVAVALSGVVHQSPLEFFNGLPEPHWLSWCPLS